MSFPLERLDEPLVPEPPYTAYTQFIGVTQHGLSHAGQMALLKKALGSADPAPPPPNSRLQQSSGMKYRGLRPA